MRMIAILLAGSLMVPAATAQVKPLPQSPLLRQPTAPQPTTQPLQIAEVPGGQVFIPISAGTGSTISLPVRTTGGTGAVTVSLQVSGANASDFQLADPPSSGVQLVAPPVNRSIAAATVAPDVRKLITVRGRGTIPASMPAKHTVTIVARDNAGVEQRRSFDVVYTRAGGKAQIATGVTAIPVLATDRARLTQAQHDVTPNATVGVVPWNLVTLRPASGTAISWHGFDPDSEVICIYGTFRYACEVETGASPASLPTSLAVRVPDLGRGNTVRIVLKNPYGESNAATVTINSLTTVALRETIVFNGVRSGPQQVKVSPAMRGMGILKNADSKPCDAAYLVWDNLTTDGKVYDNPAALVSLKFVGGASVRVVSVPRNQPISDSPDTGWATVEFTLPLGLSQSYLTDLLHSYHTRIGECPAKRR